MGKIRLLNVVVAFWQSGKREWHFLCHHRWDFAMLFWLPLLTIGLVWWIFAKSYIIDIPIGVVDDSRSSHSQMLINYVNSTPDVRVYRVYADRQQAKQDLQTTKIYGLLEIDSQFSLHLLSAKPAPIVLHVNAQYGSHSGILQKGVQTAVATFSAGAKITRQVKQGNDIHLVYQNFSPIQSQRISLFNTANNYQQFLATTALPALLHILAMVIGASAIGRELRDKTLDEWYLDLLSNRQNLIKHDGGLINDTNSPNFWLIFAGLNGKLIWAKLAYSLWGAVCLILTIFIQQANLLSWLVVYVCFLGLMWLSFWLGMIFSVATFSLRMGLSMTGFISAPSFAFTGVTFPYVAIADGAKIWANLLPLTHYLRVQIPQLQMAAPIGFALPIVFWFWVMVLMSMGLGSLLTKRAFVYPDKWGKR